jgi:NTP pyrophosphatase (non-canonical NTP hydrolase)
MCYAQDAITSYDDNRAEIERLQADAERNNARMHAKTLEEMQAEVYHNNVDHGWHENARPFGEDIALLHTEVSEAFEAYRLWGLDDATADVGMSGGVADYSALPKPEGVGSELADVFIRLLDTVDRAGIDLRAEYERKMAYNRRRAFKHGGKRA